MTKKNNKRKSLWQAWLQGLLAPPVICGPQPLSEPAPLTREDLTEMLKASENPGSRKLPKDLRNFDFRNANLMRVDFRESDVTDALFRDADLREANLKDVKGLIPEQLAGAVLTRCKLPDEVKGFPQLENVKEVSKNAGALFLTMILACVFVLITTVSTRDMQLLTNTGTAQLPFLNVAVATTVFFTTAPIVLILLYSTAHLYLQRLWALMAKLPAVFPDGTRVDRKTYPWLLNDLIQTAFPRIRPRFFDHVHFFALIAYGTVPFAVFVVWLRCLAKHDPTLSYWQAVFLISAVAAGLRFQTMHRQAMGKRFGPLRWRLLGQATALGMASLTFLANLSVLQGIPVAPSMAQSSMIESLGLLKSNPGQKHREGLTDRLRRLAECTRRIGRIQDANGRLLVKNDKDLRACIDGAIRNSRLAEQSLSELNEWGGDSIRYRIWVLLAWQPFFEGFGDLTEDLSRRADHWQDEPSVSLLPTPCEEKDLLAGNGAAYRERVRQERKIYAQWATGVSRASFVKLGRVNRPNLRFLQARGAFLINSDFRGADLTGADFAEADLRGVLWRDPTIDVENSGRPVDLSLACLSKATLVGTDLYGATLTGASLSGATLIGSQFSRATLMGADLARAVLTGSCLSSARLTATDMSNAILIGVDLSHATLVGANLYYAILKGAHLYQATLVGANLSGVDLRGADLEKAKLTGADLSDTILSGSLNLEKADLDGAVFAAKQVPTLPPDWRLESPQGPLVYAPNGKTAVEYQVQRYTNPKTPDKPYRILRRKVS